MAGTASELHAGVAAALSSIPGIRVADHVPEGVNPPQAIVQLDQVTYHRAMAGGLSEWRFVVVMVAGRMGERTAQSNIDAWLSWDGDASVRAALEVPGVLLESPLRLVGELLELLASSVSPALLLLHDFQLEALADVLGAGVPLGERLQQALVATGPLQAGVGRTVGVLAPDFPHLLAALQRATEAVALDDELNGERVVPEPAEGGVSFVETTQDVVHFGLELRLVPVGAQLDVANFAESRSGH